jgi:activator of 2-hydroxyglutaryl-CoA dehydratase
MQPFLLKCLLVSTLIFTTNVNVAYHPIFVSVTEIEHNTKTKSLEISTKIFTDDFEKTLRAAYKTKVDLLDGLQKVEMDKLVSDYIKKHLVISIDGKPTTIKYVGYENIEEAIYCYFEIENIDAPKKISIADDILYEYKKEQMSILHVTVGGKRQSTKLSNPEKVAEMRF